MSCGLTGLEGVLSSLSGRWTLSDRVMGLSSPGTD